MNEEDIDDGGWRDGQMDEFVGGFFNGQKNDKTNTQLKMIEWFVVSNLWSVYNDVAITLSKIFKFDLKI